LKFHIDHKPKRDPLGQHISFEANRKALASTYTVKNDLVGSRTMGKIFRAESKHDSTIKVAIKVFRKEDAVKHTNEIQILSTLDHPNIVAYHEIF